MIIWALDAGVVKNPYEHSIASNGDELPVAFGLTGVRARS